MSKDTDPYATSLSFIIAIISAAMVVAYGKPSHGQEDKAPSLIVPKITILRHQNCAALGINAASFGRYQQSTTNGKLQDERISTLRFMPPFGNDVLVEVEWKLTLRWKNRPTPARLYQQGRGWWFGPTASPFDITFSHGQYYEVEKLEFPQLACHRITPPLPRLPATGA